MNKFRSYSFWLSVAGAVGLVINNVGKAVGFSFDSQILTEVVDSICGVLILFGIVTISKNDKAKDDVTDENVLDNQSFSKANSTRDDAIEMNVANKNISKNKNENASQEYLEKQDKQ